MIRLRILKWGTVAATCLFAVLSLAVAILPAALRSSWGKGKVVAFLSDVLDASVEIQGAIILDLGMSPELSVTGVQIKFAGDASELREVRAGELRIAAPILPNLRGRYTIERVLVREAALRVALADGNAEPGAEAPTEQPSASVPVLPVVQQLEFDNVRISVEGTPVLQEIRVKRLTGEELNGAGEGSLSSDILLDGEPANLSLRAGSVNAFFAGSELPIVLAAGYGAHRLGIKGSIHPTGRVEIHLEVSGSETASFARLTGATVPELGPFQVVAEVLREPGESQSIRVDGLKLTVRDRPITGRVAIDLGVRGASEGELSLESGVHQISGKGKLGADGELAAEVRASSKALADLNHLVGFELPPWRDLALSARIVSPSVSEGPFRVENLDLRVGSSDLAGSIDLSLAPLAVKTAIESKELNLVELSGPSAETGEGSSSKPQPPAVDEPRIPYDALGVIEGDVRLRVGRLTTSRGLNLEEVDLSAILKGGKLEVSQLGAEVFGGSLSGNASISPDGVRLTLSGNRFGASPIALLAGSQPFMTGEFDLAVDLSGRGDTFSQIMQTLGGTMTISSENARIESATLDAAGSGLHRILAPVFGGSGRAKSECLLFSYDVKSGIARTRELVVQLGEVFLFGTGKLNLRKQELAYNFNVNSNNPALASLIPPFRAYGKLSNPYFVPSVSGSIASVADSAEGVLDTATGLVMGVGQLFGGGEVPALKGIELCRYAYQVERRRISSLVGDAVSGRDEVSGEQPRPAVSDQQSGQQR